MALTQLEVNLANMSLGRIGSKQFTLAVQTAPEGVQSNLHFAHTRDSLLRSFRWNFAIKRLAIVGTWSTGTVYITDQYIWINSLLYKCVIAHTAGTFATDLSAVKWTLVTTRPSFGYAYQYSLPSDCLRFIQTDYDDDEYNVEGKLVVTSEQTMNAEYVYQVTDTTLWDSLFTECFILKLAINILHPLAGTSVVQMRQMLESELRQLLSKAVTVSASETNSSGNSDWNEARYL